MKNVLILHGAGNNSSGNWFPWLKDELEKRGFAVWVPDLPNADRPSKKLWLQTVFNNKQWNFSDQTIIVGHSAGATLILRILEKLPTNIVIAKSILVAGPVERGTKKEYFKYKEDFVRDPFQWEKIKKSSRKFYLFYSASDMYECGIDQGRIIHQHVGGELIFKPDEGHFNLEKGQQYKKFPQLLETILI